MSYKSIQRGSICLDRKLNEPVLLLQVSTTMPRALENHSGGIALQSQITYCTQSKPGHDSYSKHDRVQYGQPPTIMHRVKTDNPGKNLPEGSFSILALACAASFSGVCHIRKDA